MRKIKLGGLVILASLFLGGCTLFGKGDKTTESLPDGQESFSGTLKAAIALGVPMKCTSSINGIESEGWIKGKQYLGKTTMQNGSTVNVLMKDECMWSWGEGETTGTTMCFEPVENESIWDDTGESTPEKVNCRPAAVTNSKFNPPSNIDFVDMDAMTGGDISEEDMKKLEEMNTVDFGGWKE